MQTHLGICKACEQPADELIYYTRTANGNTLKAMICVECYEALIASRPYSKTDILLALLVSQNNDGTLSAEIYDMSNIPFDMMTLVHEACSRNLVSPKLFGQP